MNTLPDHFLQIVEKQIICNFTSNDEKMIIKKLLEEITNILKTEGAQKIILFGSYAYGDPDEHSDLDLIVISPEDNIPVTNHERMTLHHRYNSRITKYRELISIDLMVYTRGMFEKLMISPNLFFREVNQNGKVLYESNN